MSTSFYRAEQYCGSEGCMSFAKHAQFKETGDRIKFNEEKSNQRYNVANLNQLTLALHLIFF